MERGRFMKIVKKILLVVLILIGIVVLTVGGYAIYLEATYDRISDFLPLEVEQNPTDQLQKDQTYSIITYNLGFGAYSPDFTFFMDEGKMLSGEKTKGKYGKARSKSEVETNTTGSIDVLKQVNPDFIFLQEVDRNSTRSHHANQKNLITSAFDSYGFSFISNFHSEFLMYPLNDPHGRVDSGMMSLSRYQVSSSLRRSLPISTHWLNKLFDLDRCIHILRLKIEEKELVLINVHLSAYDKGGVYRKQQINLLNTILEDEQEKGNYVIVGGDFNHDIADSASAFKTNQQQPDWLSFLSNSDLPNGYQFATTKEVPTCRGADVVYEKDKTYTVVVDGFIVSDNIEVIESKNIQTDFAYSDHNPAFLEFRFR